MAINKKLTRKFDIWRTGVTTDNFTPKGAIIMAASVLLYGIIQARYSALQGAPSWHTDRRGAPASGMHRLSQE
jgi:hypothetical protein